MVGRLVVGLGVGGSAIVVPAYLAEIAPAKHRGAVVQMYEVRAKASWTGITAAEAVSLKQPSILHHGYYEGHCLPIRG